MSKAHIRLNPKKLYQADGYAVKELLKIANVLKQAQHRQGASAAESLADADARAVDMKKVRTLASELTKRGAIFMKNYNRMVEHNKEFAAGRVSWARRVNQWYDLTEEEWAADAHNQNDLNVIQSDDKVIDPKDLIDGMPGGE